MITGYIMDLITLKQARVGKSRFKCKFPESDAPESLIAASVWLVISSTGQRFFNHVFSIPLDGRFSAKITIRHSRFITGDGELEPPRIQHLNHNIEVFDEKNKSSNFINSVLYSNSGNSYNLFFGDYNLSLSLLKYDAWIDNSLESFEDENLVFEFIKSVSSEAEGPGAAKPKRKRRKRSDFKNASKPGNAEVNRPTQQIGINLSEKDIKSLDHRAKIMDTNRNALLVYATEIGLRIISKSTRDWREDEEATDFKKTAIRLPEHVRSALKAKSRHTPYSQSDIVRVGIQALLSIPLEPASGISITEVAQPK